VVFEAGEKGFLTKKGKKHNGFLSVRMKANLGLAKKRYMDQGSLGEETFFSTILYMRGRGEKVLGERG